MYKSNSKNVLYKTCVLVLITLCFSIIIGCSQNSAKPDFHYTGYKTKSILQDTFLDPSLQWIVEGDGIAQITNNHQLAIHSDSLEKGMVVWSNREFDGDFQVEYVVDFPESSGVHLIFLCARGVNNQDMFEDTTPRSGHLDEYANGEIQNYHIACHTYRADGTHAQRSTIRKNPGRLLLSQTSSDPCRDSRKYLIDIIKIGGRIKFFVDGLLIHDVTDKGGFGPVYDQGRLGLWFQGTNVVHIDRVAVYQLKPE